MAVTGGGGNSKDHLYLNKAGMAGLAQTLRSSGHLLASVAEQVDFASAADSLAGTGLGRALGGVGDVVERVFGGHATEADESAWKLDRVVEIYTGRADESAVAPESTE